MGTVRNSKRHSQLYHVALKQAREEGIAGEDVYTNPGDALQQMVNRLVAQLRFASLQVDGLKIDELVVNTAFGPLDHQWVRMESRLQDRLITLCTNMERIGIADRSVQVSEAFAAILVPMLRGMLNDLELTPEQRLKAPAVIEGALLTLERSEDAV